jgi:large subunit ribosomal protein L29
MKRKEKENLRNMSEVELKAQLRDLGKQLFQMKFRRASSPLENPLEIRSLRRKMAVIRTFIGDKTRVAADVKVSEVKK